MGRPAAYNTPEELEIRIKLYFDQFKPRSEEEAIEMEIHEIRPTITGLCLFCGFESRQSFYDYEKKEGFTYTIKRAKARIENVYEQYLGTKYATGAIFALKNFDWSDKQEIEFDDKRKATSDLFPDELGKTE